MKPIQIKTLTLGLMAAIAVLLAGLGLLASSRSSAADAAKPGAAAAKPALTVTLTQAQAGNWPVKLAANGSIAAWQEASVAAEANGLRVQELLASVGDSVQRGQVLASFAPETVQADVALAKATLAEAGANAAEAAANAERARAVQGSGALSAQQISQYLTQDLTARARVASAQAQLDSQLLRLKHTRLLAPDAGIISLRSAMVGTVAAAGTEMFRLIRQSRLEWRAEVTSSELGRITAGTAVRVTAPGGAQLRGRVRLVSPTVDALTRNGLVYVDLISPPAAGKTVAGAFKPGMFARGEFELGQSRALAVLQTAVLVRDGFSYVMRVGSDNRVSQLKVQTGRVLGDRVEIVSGLKPEDRLVASGASFLSDGDGVRVVAAAPEFLKEKSPPAHAPPALSATQ
ncbi:MAG: efflux RND transporter periplasmic adaptor subunit [Rhodoferax sp.]|nr:efflux RND transporter periplasmic adaptor subunit [Rhodoferax sp.]